MSRYAQLHQQAHRHAQRLGEAAQRAPLLQAQGKVQSVMGLGIRATIPETHLGQTVQIMRKGTTPLLAEVQGFVQNEAIVIPLGTAEHMGPGDPVVCARHGFTIPCGPALLGRVLDGLGRPIDAKGPLHEQQSHTVQWQVERDPPAPLERKRIDTPLVTGVRAIDGLLTLGQGQRVGIFSGSGVGKSTLLGQIARHSSADVFVVALVGERGREVREFIEDCLGEQGLARGVVVAATGDSPPLVRLRSAHVATSIAEYFRDQGKNVLLMMDSLTRYARAAREVGLTVGELPARRGYPPSVFTRVASLVERAGQSGRGSITALYTVLVEGSDLDEPVADEVRGLLDGHIVLDRALTSRGRFPAIDVLQSISRLQPQITRAEVQQCARQVREWLGLYEAKRDLVLLGAYRPGSDPRLDEALQKADVIEAFLRQPSDEHSTLIETYERLRQVVASPA
jgi:FliI/YscN family ATPase